MKTKNLKTIDEVKGHNISITELNKTKAKIVEKYLDEVKRDAKKNNNEILGKINEINFGIEEQINAKRHK